MPSALGLSSAGLRSQLMMAKLLKATEWCGLPGECGRQSEIGI